MEKIFLNHLQDEFPGCDSSQIAAALHQADWELPVARAALTATSQPGLVLVSGASGEGIAAVD